MQTPAEYVQYKHCAYSMVYRITKLDISFGLDCREFYIESYQTLFIVLWLYFPPYLFEENFKLSLWGEKGYLSVYIYFQRVLYILQYTNITAVVRHFVA